MTDNSPQGRMAAELASLKVFRGRVDEIITTLGESEAAPTRITEGRLNQEHLGTGFTAAKVFYDIYHDVHADLTTLSQLLNDQIEALSVAVRDAHGGYANTDVDVRDRMWAIQNELKRHYDPSRDPEAKRAKTEHGPPSSSRSQAHM
ncbi:hypothetical protein [Streptomyces sp. ISL-11]|uniref:hypothetical protein n=1 Tax=Streptomyces sp. ISL-11 TaxID=2819174 RepID=UPI001BE589FD|nr:hypothetical protein [Streptomyces sp. ISL-11]MBT2383790.1 hypothetical protein [Streptomyces sp. ISL-11]